MNNSFHVPLMFDKSGLLAFLVNVKFARLKAILVDFSVKLNIYRTSISCKLDSCSARVREST
jgi:hypothetical protein